MHRPHPLFAIGALSHAARFTLRVLWQSEGGGFRSQFLLDTRRLRSELLGSLEVAVGNSDRLRIAGLMGQGCRAIASEGCLAVLPIQIGFRLFFLGRLRRTAEEEVRPLR
jgi:hypothetical protein